MAVRRKDWPGSARVKVLFGNRLSTSLPAFLIHGIFCGDSRNPDSVPETKYDV
jgi:hypothetical protein